MAAPKPGSRTISADRCERCGSMWFDEHELREIDAQLAALPFREFAPDEALKSSLATCPRCAASGKHGPVEVTLLDVKVDFCRSCNGVWLQGDELMALLRATEDLESRQDLGAYRTSARAARAIASGEFTCPRCQQVTPKVESCIVPGGLVCGPCFYAKEEQSLKSSKGEGFREVMRRDRLARDTAAPQQRTSDFLWSFLGAILAGTPRFCEHCGKRRGDPECSHSIWK